MTIEFQNIPSVNSVLECDLIKGLSRKYDPALVKNLVRERIALARREVAEGRSAPSNDLLASEVFEIANTRWKNWPVRVINGTGVILHTNLGRAPLSDSALAAISQASSGYSDLELDLSSGKRGSRQSHICQLLQELTGAEAGMVVNNNASAIMLALSAIAKGKDVIVSRSEAVEIGGGFRIPDVLVQSGASLKEVGTTNRTYAKDFAGAIGENTGALLLIHASNFKIIGFTHSPTVSELSDLTRSKDIPVLHDIGSGCLLNPIKFGLKNEPMPQQSITDGSDLCFFSGDKLLGGPQAGIIVGKYKYINMLANHPLARAFRIDKLSLAALNATLLHYVRGEAEDKIPIWQMISSSKKELEKRALMIQKKIGDFGSVDNIESTIGGGSLPGETIESVGLIFPVDSPDELVSRLRNSPNPVLARIEEDNPVIDLRTVLPQEDDLLVESLLASLAQRHD